MQIRTDASNAAFLNRFLQGKTIFSSNDLKTIIMSSAPSGDLDQSGQLHSKRYGISIAKSHSFLKEESDRPDQTGRVPRLIRVIDMLMFFY